MQQKVTRFLEALVVTIRKLQPKATGVLARAQKRAQRDHVIVRRLLAMNAVWSNIREQISMQLRDRKLKQAVAIQLRQSERGDKECVELERAVIAFGRQVAT